jgi:hypothetical protein
MAKTIVRWTLGNVSDQGFDCLRLSIKKMMGMYGTEKFDYFLCHNNVPKSRLDLIHKDVELLDQGRFTESLPIPPSNKFGVSWKLYPPRIDMDRNEIFMDNDLILYKKMDFDRLGSMCFISEAARRSYGSFSERIETSNNLNSGFFGLTRGFDFAGELSKAIALFDIDWDLSYFEEQGVVAYVLSGRPHWVVGLDKISINLEEPFRLGEYGIHFVGLNKGFDKFWRMYRVLKFL